MDFTEYLTNALSAEPRKTTKAGRAVSHYTMLCYFIPGGKQEKWCYRGDDLLTEYRAIDNTAVTNQLEALLYKHSIIKENLLSCKIFNNHNTPLKQLIFSEYRDGTMPVNLVIQELAIIRSEKKNDQTKIPK